MNTTMKWAVLLLALGSAACSEPVIGRWEAEDKNTCGQRDDFEVDDELTGSGSLWLPTTLGECTECTFDLEIEAKGGGDYEGELDFDNCACEGVRTAEVDCRLKDDELDCDIDWRGPSGPCLQGSQTFVRND